MSDHKILTEEYHTNIGRAERLRVAVSQQLLRLVEENDITLAVPLESRVKTLPSILEKIERKEKEPDSIFEFDDVIGLRVILLFSRDVERVNSLIEKTFSVIRSEDTSKRLSEVQFGYQSQHYVATLPKSWLDVPTFYGLGELKAEFQVRTLGQHMWAAASHKLQYKQEVSVPQPLKRAIHRVSALLETVDLEFERVLDARTEYLKENTNPDGVVQKLNVDLLANLLDELLPAANKSKNEVYSLLLDQLIELNIETASDLRRILVKQNDAVVEFDADQVRIKGEGTFLFENNRLRNEQGVFLTHVGWVRRALKMELGEEVADRVLKKRIATRSTGKAVVGKKTKG